MTQCFECGSYMIRKCPSCEAVSAREALDEARAEGRRAGIEEAIVYLSARSIELFEVYDTTKIERRCDIYDIRNGEAEHCLGLVKTLLEAK